MRLSIAFRCVGWSTVTASMRRCRPGRSKRQSPPASAYRMVCVYPSDLLPTRLHLMSGTHGLSRLLYQSTLPRVRTRMSNSSPVLSLRRRRSGASVAPGSTTSTLRPSFARTTAVWSAARLLPITMWSQVCACKSAATAAVRKRSKSPLGSSTRGVCALTGSGRLASRPSGFLRASRHTAQAPMMLTTSSGCTWKRKSSARRT
mmetsp:Transcript_11011/g.41124  ORF Transcript_11011/g.41124 Transcript_11011/m.41124 type:complete len:203 (-) Transcript_11011:357-965(-)